MHLLTATGSTGPAGFWAYLVIFAVVAMGWAGVPAIGGAVIAGAALLASQGKLNIAAVLVASVLGTEAGGLAGYWIGGRWGRALLTHPGLWLGRRQRVLTEGEALYARWGRLAVFFTPCLVSGIARMQYSQFVAWNFLAGAVYVVSVGPAAYGAAKVSAGQHDLGSVGMLAGGVLVGLAVVMLAARFHRRRKARASTDDVPAQTGPDAQAPAPMDEV